MKTKYIILSVLIGFTAGFFLGRATVETKETVRYVKGETVTRTVKVPEPSTVFVPKVYFLPTRADTVVINDIETVVQKVDTAAIIRDYVSVKRYDFNLFDDKFGKLNVSPTLQYNKLAAFDYSFTPMTKEVTKHREKLFVPFVSVSYNTFGIAGAGGGVFYRNVGVEYNYLYDTFSKDNGHSASLKVKF